MTHYTTVTVFGGTGFIGRYVIDRLADLGVQVRVATRSQASAYFLRTAGNVGQVVPVPCNIHDDNSVARLVNGSDWVINLIGALAEKGKKGSFEAIHHQFPARLGAIAARAGVKRLVHVSALGASLDSASVYASTKAKGEAALMNNFPAATILRPSVVYGPEDGFFNLFAKLAGIFPVLPLIGGGETLFQPVYVGDVASAVMAALKEPTEDVAGKIFELGGDEVLSFRGLLERMEEYTGGHSAMVKIPFPVASMMGRVLQRLPGAMLTVDQVRQLKTDNVVSGTKPGLPDLGITPETMANILPSYLSHYAGGRFAFKRSA